LEFYQNESMGMTEKTPTPALSPDCIDRLRDLEGRLDNALRIIEISAPFNDDGLLPLKEEARSSLTDSLTVPNNPKLSDSDKDCKEVFKALEPLLGLVIDSVNDGKTVAVIRRSLEATRAYVRASKE
jgi:hypothetical protein